MCFIVSPGRGRRGVDGRDVVQRPNLAYLSFPPSAISLFSPSRSFPPSSLSLSFPPLSVSRILFVRLPTARATLGRNPNSVAKRLRRIDPTPICISFVLEREIFCVPCFIKSEREREKEEPPGLFPCLETISRFGYGKRCFKLLYSSLFRSHSQSCSFPIYISIVSVYF